MNNKQLHHKLCKKILSIRTAQDFHITCMKEKLITSIHENPETNLNLLNGKLKYISNIKKNTFQPMDVRIGSARHYTFNVEDSDVGTYNAVLTQHPPVQLNCIYILYSYKNYIIVHHMERINL